MAPIRDVKIVLKTLREHYTGLSMLASFTDKTPFQILIATALSARSRDSQTMKVVKKLFSEYPDANSMADAPIPRLEALVKQTGFYHVKAARIKEIAATIKETHAGKVPDDMEGLLSLPGVGRKTAGCVLVYAFGKPAIPVDVHVHRVSHRLGWVDTKLPEQTEQELMKIVPRRLWVILNEVMVLHGQNICKPIVPLCSKCPVEKYCSKVGVSKAI